MWCVVVGKSIQRTVSVYSLIFLFLLLFSFPGSAFADDGEVFTGEYVVLRGLDTLDGQAPKPELISQQADVHAGTPTPSIAPYNQDVAESDCALLRIQDPSITLCEPNFVVTIDAAPNDPQFGQLYGMEKIQAPDAWNVSTGSNEVIVAVLDTGIDHTHPDLAANMWVNSGEIAGNGFDDDGNGYIDDVHGYDFYNGDGDSFDDHGHGTHCAGTIGAVGNNGVGVAGVNWNVKLMGLKFLSAGGSGSTYTAVYAIDYAIAQGAHVINGSFGGRGKSQVLGDAIARAYNAGVLFVAAAGNSGTNNDVIAHYPSNFPEALAVGASGEDDTLTYFSNYGATTVDVVAPGLHILSTLPNGAYGSLSGTSMAAPHVAGLAALIKSQNPSFTPEQMMNLIRNTVDVVGSYGGKIISAGRINARKALNGEETPGSGGGGGNGRSTLTIKRFGKKGGLTRNGNWKAVVTTSEPGTYSFSMELRSKNGDSIQCDLGDRFVTERITLSGRLSNTSARVAVFQAGDDASKKRRIRKSTKSLSKKTKRRLGSLESTCARIAAGVRAR